MKTKSGWAKQRRTPRFKDYMRHKHKKTKVGLRMPDVISSIKTRKPFVYFTHPKRAIVHGLGIKLPRGGGLLRNPKKWLYNKEYRLLTADPISKLRRSAGRKLRKKIS